MQTLTATQQTRKPSIKTIEEKTQELEKLAKELRIEGLDKGIKEFLKAIQLLDDLKEVQARLRARINEKLENYTFTLSQLKEIEHLQEAEQDLQFKVCEFSYAIERLEKKLNSLIPKVKDNFRVRTNKYLIEVKNKEITRIEVLDNGRVNSNFRNFTSNNQSVFGSENI